jgi:hypothetical protein
MFVGRGVVVSFSQLIVCCDSWWEKAVNGQWQSDFMFHFCHLCLISINVHSSSSLYSKSKHFPPNWPSWREQGVVLKEYDVLLFYCNYLGLILCWCLSIFLFGLSLASDNLYRVLLEVPVYVNINTMNLTCAKKQIHSAQLLHLMTASSDETLVVYNKDRKKGEH